ncbi:MAG TPA: ATP-binding cassette domain-containing protein [Gemmatimonadaceae bacterium]|nr:ATP-binding cassette domain-containing protein [Gemmatimonadaceae bacterium]
MKRFHHYERRPRTLRELFIRTLRGDRPAPARATFTLSGLDLRIDRGEAVALVGANGSGKSTALRLMAGIYPPSAGTIETTGRVAAVIELGAGFHPELTGRENAALYAATLGLAASEIADRLPEALAFADIGAFVDEPAKYYSSGMAARLAYAVAAVCARPDVLLLDEVLAVGDQRFRERCFEHLGRFRDGGGTLVIVSHDADALRRFCGRGVWVDAGRVRMTGPIDDVLAAYAGAAE